MEPNLAKDDTVDLEKFSRLITLIDIWARMPHIPVPQKITSLEILCNAAELARQKLKSDCIIDNPMGSSNTEHVIAYAKPSVNNRFINKNNSGE